MRTKKPKPKPWTTEQEMDLFNGVSISGVAWFKRHCGRSVYGIYKKVHREYGPGGLTRGAYTLWELARVTGYSRTHLRRAQAALGQKWKRLGPRGAHIITEEQLEELATWLTHDYWSKTHRQYGCVWCSTSKRPSVGLGLCGRCYYRHRRLCQKLGLPVQRLEQLKLWRRITRSEGDKSGNSGRVMKDGLTRLESGLALTEAQLDWLALLE